MSGKGQGEKRELRKFLWYRTECKAEGSEIVVAQKEGRFCGEKNLGSK